ncbi:MAG: chlorophyll synthesis pathway protein BchC [Proteobacteria bacterium]|nr:chlorophyll synthesis pathway protein BchC [Pseudomonadota bacterium]
METTAVVMHAPEQLSFSRVQLCEPAENEVVVDVTCSGISAGTERLFWTGRMPSFPGMGYPLVPGYESVGRIAQSGQRVFVPGARCFGPIRGLFGGAAARLVVAEARTVKLRDSEADEHGVLLALAATAAHALSLEGARLPDLIVGHGVVGRLIARIAIALGAPPPTVWENAPLRHDGAEGYTVVAPDTDPRRDYYSIYDASGAAGLLDTLIARLAPGGEVVLAGFYAEPLSFAFAPAFMREARLRIAAEWRPDDLALVRRLLDEGKLSLDGLVTHRRPAAAAEEAYRIAFGDPACLKMVLDWKGHA